MGGLDLRDVGVGVEDEIAAFEHHGGKVAHDRLGLKVQAAQHFVRTPSSQKSH